MFIRETFTTDRKTKKTYRNYQLVESYRTDHGPRQRILLTLGADLDLAKQEQKELANRIEEILKGQILTMFPSSEKIESYAQKFAAEIRDLWLNREQPKPAELTPPKDFACIDVNSIEKIDPRTVGSEHLLLHIAEELELPKQLKKLGLTEKETALALGAIIGRATFPASERATHQWLTHRSGLGELLDYNFHDTNLDQLYHISDTLLSLKEPLEVYLEHKEANLYGLQSTMVLYDLTNTYMEGRARGNPKAAHGVSKEKRGDCPLVTLGIVINEHGFLSRSSFLPGNISEPKTFIESILALEGEAELIKPIVVMDAGIATEDNLQWLREHHYPYLVSARQRAPSMELVGDLISVDAATSEVRVAYVKEESKEERWLYCESEAKGAVATAMKNKFQEHFEEDLQKLQDSLSKPKGRKSYEKVLLKIGRLKEKHKAISGCYDVTVTASSDGKIAEAISWSVQPEKIKQKLTSYYFLRTNVQGISPQELWHLYGNLRTVEDGFRFMKSSLGMRPVYHQTERRVDGHLWITILAYHLIHNCMYRLRKAGIQMRWNTIRDMLSTRMRITMRAKTDKNETLHYRSSTQVEDSQTKIYQALHISPQILKGKKFYA